MTKHNVLLDDLIKFYNENNIKTNIGNSWYYAKDEEFYGISTLFQRIKSAYLVLIGKARVYHFKEDEN